MNEADQKLYELINQGGQEMGEYRCVDCDWAERVEIHERKRPAGVLACPDCGGDIRGYDEVLHSQSLLRFLKQ